MSASPAARLAEVLAACVSVDNARRKAGEEALKQFTKEGHYLQCLLECATASPDVQVRQLSLSQVRKWVVANPAALNPQIRGAVRSALQEVLLRGEESSVVRRLAGQALAATAKKALPGGEWPDFLPWLHDASKSPDAVHREIALMVFASLMCYLGTDMRQHFALLAEVCGQGLGDSSVAVQRVALQAVGTLGEWATEPSHVQAIHTLLPNLLQLTHAANVAEDEETTIEALNTLAELLDSSLPLLTGQLPHLVTWCMQVVCDAAKPLVVRQSALQVIETLSENKPKQFVKTGLVRQTVEALCRMCAEPDPEDYEEDSDELPSNKVASQALDALAQQLPSAQVFPAALQYSQAHIASSNAEERRGACDVMVVMAEGCAKLVRKHLSAVLQVVLAGVRDPHHKVRGAAIFAIGQLAEHCQPEVGQQAREVLPAVFTVVNDSDPEVGEQANYALQAFCDALEEGVVEYLGDLVTCLGQVLQHGKPDSKKSALRALASAAGAAEAAFVPHIPDLLPVLQHFMSLTEGELLECRGPATECCGLICQAVGTAPLQQHLPAFIAAVFQGFELDDSELREYSHLFLSNVAAAMKEGFAPYLQPAMQRVMQSLMQDDGADNSADDHPDKEDDGSVDLNSEEESGSDESERERRLNIHTAVLEEKSAALHALGTFAECAPASFGPYIEESLKMVVQLADYFHDSVRDEAYTALAALLKATLTCYPAGPTGEASPQVRHIVESSLPPLLNAIEDDDSKEGVASALVALAEFLSSGACPPQGLQQACKCATKLLKGEALCQGISSDADEWEAEEEKEDNGDEVVLQAVADLVAAVVKVAGPAYAPIWQKEHCKPVLNCLKSSKPPAVRAAAMGLVADVIKGVGSSMPALDSLLPVIKRELRCEEAENRRDAVFCLGLIAEKQPAVVQNQIGTLLQAVHPLFVEDNDAAVVDNAAGAVARMLQTSNLANFPLEQVVPVLLGALPLKEDFEEAQPIYACLTGLLADAGLRPRLQESLPRLLAALEEVQGQPEVPQQVKGSVLQALAAHRGVKLGNGAPKVALQDCTNLGTK